MITAVVIAWAATLLQTLGYLLYVRGALRHRIDPNPTSWLMWAYGTALVVLIETDQGIHPLLRLLPIACASCSVLVAALCWRQGALAWPRDRSDRAALSIDLALTAAYVTLSLAALAGTVPETREHSAKMLLLVCVSTSSITSYLPILRSTRRTPTAEEWLPWAVWTSAYAALLLATILVEGTSPAALQFWIYPAICLVLSGMVGWYALKPRLSRHVVPVTPQPPGVEVSSRCAA
jgi:uncharacterized membrane protein